MTVCCRNTHVSCTVQTTVYTYYIHCFSDGYATLARSHGVSLTRASVQDARARRAPRRRAPRPRAASCCAAPPSRWCWRRAGGARGLSGTRAAAAQRRRYRRRHPANVELRVRGGLACKFRVGQFLMARGAGPARGQYRGTTHCRCESCIARVNNIYMSPSSCVNQYRLYSPRQTFCLARRCLWSTLCHL